MPDVAQLAALVSPIFMPVEQSEAGGDEQDSH
jgi:hypothetical protein